MAARYLTDGEREILKQEQNEAADAMTPEDWQEMDEEFDDCDTLADWYDRQEPDDRYFGPERCATITPFFDMVGAEDGGPPF